MGRPGGALRYAELEASTSADAGARDERGWADVDFGDARGDEKKSNDTTTARTARDGAKSFARLEARLAARAKRSALRDALDLIRQQELLENMQRREARSRQRRWYVLGRALDDMMEADAALRKRVMAACDDYLVRDDERGLLGLPLLGTRSK